MEENLSAAVLMESMDSKIQQLQKAFAELERHRAVTLNLKWEQIEEHFHGLQKSLKRRFTELEEQEKEFNTKTAESRKILEERKAAIVSKEQASLQKLQERRDVAVSAILTSMGKQDKPFSFGAGVVTCKNQIEAPVHDKTHGTVITTENMNVKVNTYPELVKLCQEMNSEGLHTFISENRKDLATLRDEIPIALKAAPDPPFLVLDSLKGFYGSGVNVTSSDAKKDSNLLGLRRTCIMLMECLFSLFQNVGMASISNIISEYAKEQAKSIAEEWKPKLDYLDMDASNGNSLEVHAFLQLLASFGINSDFDQEFLSKLIPMVSRRRQTAELCRYLGLSDKMPGVINVLVKNGRHIDAVNLAFAFEITDQFSPIALLKSYLSEAKRVSSITKSGNTSPSASPQNDTCEKEVTALKAVIKCIEEHKLEDQFPTDPLHKQLVEIEKAKADKKRATEVAKPQSKRPCANSRVAKATNNYIMNSYGRVSERYPQYVYYANGGPPNHRHGHHHHHHIPSYVPTPAYTFSPSPGRGGFFGNGYQYQYQSIYMH